MCRSVGGSMPAMIFSRVDLPQPDGPTTLTNSPSASGSATRSSARIWSPSRVSYSFRRPLMRSAPLRVAHLGHAICHSPCRSRPSATPCVSLRSRNRHWSRSLFWRLGGFGAIKPSLSSNGKMPPPMHHLDKRVWHRHCFNFRRFEILDVKSWKEIRALCPSRTGSKRQGIPAQRGRNSRNCERTEH